MAPIARQTFADRVHDLGASCWWVDEASAVTCGPVPTDLEVARLECTAFRRTAAALADRAGTTRAAAVADDGPGSLTVAFPAVGGTAAVVVVGDATGGPGRDQLVRVVGHYHADLAKVADLERAADEFAERLSQSFEESNLVFRLARLLHGTGDPLGVMTAACDELRGVLPFAWVAVRFADGPRVLPAVRGRLVVAGDHPAVDALARAAGLLGSTAGGPTILVPATSDLAAACGAEILVQPIVAEAVPVAVIVAGNKREPDPCVGSAETQLVAAAAGFLGLFHENAARFADQRALFMGTLQALTAAVDAKDPYTRGHSDRVGLLAAGMAAALGLPPADVETYRIAGLVHDVGKIGVPEAVLRKAGPLSAGEFAEVRRHPEVGFGILQDIDAMAAVRPGVLSHHERWDGHGYPHGLAGPAIPTIARVLALADTFDAMSSNRSYRPAMPRSRVLSELARSAGTQFDPALVPHFVALDFTPFDDLLARSPDRRPAGLA